MRVLSIFVAAITLLSCAGTQERDLESFSADAVEGMTLPEYTQEDSNNQELKAKAAFIYTLLHNTVELNTHRMNGETENQVFVHDSGGEAVYDKNGNLVKNCENMGSYNYAHYKKEPLLHFAVDMLPWLRWGNCREDTTTQEQRVGAYIMDIANALEISRSSEVGYFLPEGFSFSSSAQNQAIAFFLAALDQSDFDLYNFILNGQGSEEKRMEFLEILEAGFISNLKMPNKLSKWDAVTGAPFLRR